MTVGTVPCRAGGSSLGSPPGRVRTANGQRSRSTVNGRAHGQLRCEARRSERVQAVLASAALPSQADQQRPTQEAHRPEQKLHEHNHHHPLMSYGRTLVSAQI
jgi:hypothetical protein